MTEKKYEIISGKELIVRLNAVTVLFVEQVCWAINEGRDIRRDSAEQHGTEFHDTRSYYLRSTDAKVR